MATVSGASSSSLIDVGGLVSQLMQIEQQPLQKLQVKEAAYQSKLTAYGQLKGALSAVSSSLSALAKADTFAKGKATSNDNAVVSASASASAVPGTYQIEVETLAQSHKIATSAASAYAATTTSVGTGTITIQFGTYNAGHTTFTANPDKATKSISIPSGSDSLAGVRDAINAANAGVAATIVNDGGGYRLVMTSNESGAANAIKLTVTDNDGDNTNASGLSALVYDPAGSGVTRATEVAAAKSALVHLDGIDITSNTNTLSTAIEGVTLTLTKTNVGSKATIAISRDTASVSSALNTFVKTYNESAKLIDGLTAYDAGSGKAGALQSDTTARGALTELRRSLTTPLAAASGDYTRLTDIGLAFDTKGQLALDSNKLQAALAADPAKVSRLFALSGQGSDARVQFSSATNETRAGIYPVTVSQVATQGTLVASAAAALTITSGVNDTLAVNIDGTAGSITLPAQTYASADALATDLQTRINGLTGMAAANAKVKVTNDGGVLTIQSARFGSTSKVSVSGSAAADLFGGAPVATDGVDIAGTINGSTATGGGQNLTATVGNARGLTLNVAATTVGAYGTVNYFEGFASKVTSMIDAITSATGSIQARTDGINRSIKSLGKDQVTIQRRLVELERRYKTQYSALDAALQSMQSTSTYLTQQLAALSAQTK